MAGFRAVVFCAAMASFSWTSASATVLVTGATGRTGSLLYKALHEAKLGDVRALIRNVTLARQVLGCKACDASEGIFVGDVTQPSTLDAAFAGDVDSLAIAVGAPFTASAKEIEAIEFQGVKNQVAALLKSGNVAGKRVMLISSMGTTDPKEGNIFFYKLNAEAFMEASGVPFAIIKPCGLSNDIGNERELMAGHDDGDLGTGMIPRADVAGVGAAALAAPPAAAIRFDLCAKAPGTGPGNPEKVLMDALMPWQRSATIDIV